MEAVVDRIEGPKYADRRLEWQDIHAKLVGLAKRRAGQDFEEGQWLLKGMKAAVHVALSYGSYFEYVERIFGYSPRIAAERIRVAQALEELPQMAAALRTGEISWSTARELTRVAVVSTEREWLDASKAKTVRQVERMVSGRTKGDRPDDPPDETARRHVVRFEVGGDVLALLREAQAELVRRTGAHLEDEDVVRLLAASVLGGSGDEGRAAYQVAMTICARCGDGKQEACGEGIPVTPTVVERACCDAQDIGPANPEPGTRPRASQTIPPAIRREVLRRHGGRCAVPGCTHSTFVEVHHLDRRSEGGTHDPLRLIPLCSAHHAAEHDGRLIIEGDAVSGFRFYHGDRTTYGAATAPASTMAWADAFSMLKNLGFKEGEVRGALEAVRPDLDRTADTEAIVRAGLRRLHLDRHERTRARPTPATPPTPPVPPKSSPTPKSPTTLEAPSDRRESNQAKHARGSSQAKHARGSSQAKHPRGSSQAKPDPRGSSPSRPPSAPDESPPHLARSTLVNLGFTRQQAHDAVERALTHVGADADLETLIRAALRHVPLGSRARESTVLYQAGPPGNRLQPTWAERSRIGLGRERLRGGCPPIPGQV